MFDQLLDSTKQKIKQAGGLLTSAFNAPGKALLGTVSDIPSDIKEVGQDISDALDRTGRSTVESVTDPSRSTVDKALRPVAEGARLAADLAGAVGEGVLKIGMSPEQEKKVVDLSNNAAQNFADNENVQEAAKEGIARFQTLPEATQKSLGTLGIFTLAFTDFASRGRTSQAKDSLLDVLQKTTDEKQVQEVLDFTLDKQVNPTTVRQIANTTSKKDIRKVIEKSGGNTIDKQIIDLDTQKARLAVKSEVPNATRAQVRDVAAKIVDNPSAGKKTLDDLKVANGAPVRSAAFNVDLGDIADDVVPTDSLDRIAVSKLQEPDNFDALRVVNTDEINDRVQKIVAGDNVPPVIVDGNNRVIENASTLAAYQQLKQTNIPFIKMDTVYKPSVMEVNKQRRVRQLSPAIYDSAIKKRSFFKKSDTPKVEKDTTLSNFAQAADVGLGIISTRLKNIDESLATGMRKFEFDAIQRRNDYEKRALPFLKRSRKLLDEDRIVFDLARKNGDKQTIDEILDRYDMREEYDDVRNMLDEIHEETARLGMDIGYIDDYAPRAIKAGQERAFLNHIRKTDEWSVVEEAIQKKSEATGRPISDFSEEDLAYIAQSVIRGYGNDKVNVRTPGQTKARMIDIIDADLNEFYENSDAALLKYIAGMADTIESRKFLGAELQLTNKAKNKISRLETAIARRDADIKRLNSEIEDLVDNPINTQAGETSKAWLNKIETRKRHLSDTEFTKDQIQFQLEEAKKDLDTLLGESKIEDNIGAYTMKLVAEGKLSPAQEAEFSRILKARFGYKSGNPWLHGVKNLEYISTMGTISSAITQLQDLGLSFYKFGVYDTVKSAVKKKDIKRDEIIGDEIAQEFSDPSKLAKAVNLTFKATGLNTIDRFGKETILNASVNNLRKKVAKEDPATMQKLFNMFGDELDDVVDDLKAGRNSENVRFYAFNELSDLQPISLTELPEKYLTMPNGRILYMLKTYTLKLFDIYRREAYQEIRKGNVKKGLGNLVKIGGALTLTGATADEIKSIFRPEEEEVTMSDRLMLNLLKAVGLNRYTLNQVSREGLGSTLTSQFIPPTSILDTGSKALKNMDAAELVKILPFGEDIYYNFLKERNQRQNVADSINI